MVTRNTEGHPCIAKDLGRPVMTVQLQNLMTWRGLMPMWVVEGYPRLCPYCGGIALGFLDADLTPIEPLSDNDVLREAQDNMAALTSPAEAKKSAEAAMRSTRFAR
jgi:hypothetical protein